MSEQSIELQDLLAVKRGQSDRLGAFSGVMAEAIDQLLHGSRLTQTEIAQRMGVSQTLISDWRRGKGLPSLSQLLALDEIVDKPRGYTLVAAGLVDLGALHREVCGHDNLPPSADGDLRWLVGWLAIHAPDGVMLPPRLAPLVKDCMASCDPGRFTVAVPLSDLDNRPAYDPDPTPSAGCGGRDLP